MEESQTKAQPPKAPQANLFGLLKPYALTIVFLVVLTIVSNALNLAVPKIISHAIDTFTQGAFSLPTVLVEFTAVAIFIFLFTYVQNIVQTYAAERVAKDLRTKLVAEISQQDYAFIQKTTPAKLLTNLTADIDAVKTFVSMAISSIISSAFLIVGASVLTGPAKGHIPFHPVLPQYPPEPAPGFSCHGHGHRSAVSHCHRPGRRHRHCP
jgi:ATP-binding cassette subfamily B protein